MDQTAQVQKRRVKLGRSSCSITRELSDEKSKAIPYFYGVLEEKKMGRTSAGKQSFPAKHERFRSSHFRERVVSLHGESGGLKIRRERVGTVTTHLAPWSIG